MTWRFYSRAIAGPAGGTVIDELDLGNVSIIDRLKGAGSLSAGIPSRSPHATRETLDTENVMVVAVRDDVVRFAGPLLSAGQTAGADRVSVGCEGAWNLVRRRTIRSAFGMTHGTVGGGEVRFAGVDQFLIVADLIAHLNAVRDDLNILVAYDALSGVARDRSYEADKGKSIGEAIEQLADVDDGFDWALEPSGTVDDLTLTLRLSYPRRGRNTGFRFDLDVPEPGTAATSGSGNVIAAGLTESSRDRVSRFTAVGPGEGASQLTSHAEDPSIAGALPLTEASGSWLDVTSPTTLAAHANRGQRINGRASKIPTLTVDPNAEPKLGAYITGDTVHSRISDGWMQCDGPYRIIAITTNLDDNGQETVDLDLAELERF